MRIKICGINSWDNALIALNAGVDALGFLVGITHLAEDKIEVEAAKQIIKKLPPFVSSVAVTHLQDLNKIIEMCQYLNVTTLQLHDYLSPSDVEYCRKQLPHVKIIKTIHVMNDDKDKLIEFAKSYEQVVDAILLDSRTKERLGGTGIVVDWDISKEIVEQLSIPIILAGGLKPDNVYEAVSKVKPYAVDVNSGVEINGDKDFKKVSEFIINAKKAELDYMKGM